jgi:hypothetical protein
MKRTQFALAGFALIVLACAGRAGVDADPTKDYTIKPDAGPWVILAATYVGDDAPKLAHDLILELRRKYNMSAWLWNKGGEERQKQRERWRKMHEQANDAQVPLHGFRIEEQCAVLIGGYKDIDAARRELDRIKNLKPPSDKSLMHLFFKVNRVKVGDEEMGQVEGAYVSPFIRSFVTRNPRVPVDRRAEARDDPFLKTLNADETYSLLKCRKPVTLVIATFQGTIAYESETKDPGNFLSRLLPRKTPETLGLSAMNAHNMAEFLSKAGWSEVFVLHMRTGSLVTVGGFDSKEDPQLPVVERALLGSKFNGGSVPLLPQPFAFEVPRPK